MIAEKSSYLVQVDRPDIIVNEVFNYLILTIY